MPAESAETAAEKAPRKTRKVTRKRNDPGDAPAGGYRRADDIIGKRKGDVYAMLSDSEAVKYRDDGYQRVEQSPDAPRPRWHSDDSTAGYRYKGLTLYKISADRHAELHRAPIEEADRRMGDNRRTIEATGGEGIKTRVST